MCTILGTTKGTLLFESICWTGTLQVGSFALLHEKLGRSPCVLANFARATFLGHCWRLLFLKPGLLEAFPAKKHRQRVVAAFDQVVGRMHRFFSALGQR